jgi:hypothetical protein
MGFDNLNKIIKYLSLNPNSNINSILNNCKLNRETTKRILHSLKDDNLVIKNNEKYSLSPIFCSVCKNRNNLTYFGVDLLDKDIDNFYYLFSKINNTWFEATGKNPTKTQIYKIISIINEKLNLDLPLVWYKYGQIPPVIFDTSIDYLKFTKEVDDKIIYNDIKIRDLILENINFNSKEIERIQHKQNKLYDIKDQILDHIYKDDLDFVIDNLDEFLDLTIYDPTLSSYKDNFYSFVYNYYKLDVNIRKKIEYKDIFVQVFNTMWDMIAICNFKNDIKKYYIKNNMNLENLDYYFVSELVSVKEKFNELVSRFYDYFTITDFFNDSKTQELIYK